MSTINPNRIQPTFLRVDSPAELPHWTSQEEIIQFLHFKMKPFEDNLPDIRSALDYCFSTDSSRGGFLMLLSLESKLCAVCVMLRTGMAGYIPEWILLMIAVEPSLRGQGLGEQLARKCIDLVNAPVKLHVEYNNPAKRLYERLGFRSKYADMRYYPPAL